MCYRLFCTMYAAAVHELEPTADQSPEEGQLSLEVCHRFLFFPFVVMNHTKVLCKMQSFYYIH